MMGTEMVVVSGGFDDLRSSDIRFLEEAARSGGLHVFLWSDELVRRLEGRSPRFPMEERTYLLKAVRYVSQVNLLDQLTDPDVLPALDEHTPVKWVVNEADDNAQKRIFCASNRIKYQVVKQAILRNFPMAQEQTVETPFSHKKVVVTGCYDWFHSGHVRFFEEVSELGDLYVIVGSDKNVRLLKGQGHPMFPQEERRYMVQSNRFVRQALITSGNGWMDAAPEIARIKPDIYAVNEDGDKPEKRSFCKEQGIQYVVLRRQPKQGLPLRQSLELRGF
jgi:cytidyltransferase-like protein